MQHTRTNPRLVRHLRSLPLWLPALVAMACGDDYRDKLFPAPRPGEADAGVEQAELALCRPPQTSEHLPARQVAMFGRGDGGDTETIRVQDLYRDFEAYCSSCHGPSSVWSATQDNFARQMTADVLRRMKSDDPQTVMPQPQRPEDLTTYSERVAANLPVVRFIGLIEEWLAKGRPSSFVRTKSGDGAANTAAYRLGTQVGMELTNLGNCIPHPSAMASGAMAPQQQHEQAARALDDKFAAMQTMQDLPEYLSETDMTSFDSAELAKTGVIAFAPAYTLWADYAKKLRYVRVPRGQSIQFDKEKQTFSIPDNTRFYKTFFKKVTDSFGNVRYRKMETRIIVARKDAPRVDGDDYQPRALFATYKWDEDERQARRLGVEESERYTSTNSDFRDHIMEYDVNEREVNRLLAEGKATSDSQQVMFDSGARRHYAIPGADRCIHCHMGAPGADFILGFTPLQIHRRPLGEGGVIEPAEPDELNQFQRLIDYGLISGASSPGEVTPLEESQGERKPRNEHELNAQGYMLGNCAHCHNPQGFPSWREGVLKEDLDFLPSAGGGIFQFPLTKMSRRTYRGADQTIEAPYITPSLFDNPKVTGDETLKWIRPKTPTGSEVDISRFLIDPLLNYGDSTSKEGRPLLAPWRSLLYRNVDAPFSYDDGVTIFPHMPMDTPGYDCRARQLLGSWMVSIPSRRKFQSVVPVPLRDLEEMAEKSDQPYEEVSPLSLLYTTAEEEAKSRLDRFRASERYSDCPDPELDIQDPEVASGQRTLPQSQLTDLSKHDETYRVPAPARSHYSATDLRKSDVWSVRRQDWMKILVVEKKDQAKLDLGADIARSSELVLGTILQMPYSGSLRELALQAVPVGLWEERTVCAQKLSMQPTLASLPNEGRPRWVQENAVDLPNMAHLYSVPRGAQVFNQICAKCHGSDATGNSALASTIADLTGGRTKVANLRDGLFSSARAPEFGKAEGREGVSADTWAARYLVWMGLGGTTALIPSTVVTQVGAAKVLGLRRSANFAASSAADAANMLTVAERACKAILGQDNAQLDFNLKTGQPWRSNRQLRDNGEPESLNSYEDVGLVTQRGEQELWELLCEYANPPPVRVLEMVLVADPKSPTGNKLRVQLRGSLTSQRSYQAFRHRSSYPASTPVGDHQGNTASELRADNLEPWCVVGSPEAIAQAKETIRADLPVCPPQYELRTGLEPDASMLKDDELRTWALRGAANAGMAVFAYLDAVGKGQLKASPNYNECDKLP